MLADFLVFMTWVTAAILIMVYDVVRDYLYQTLSMDIYLYKAVALKQPITVPMFKLMHTSVDGAMPGIIDCLVNSSEGLQQAIELGATSILVDTRQCLPPTKCVHVIYRGMPHTVLRDMRRHIKDA